MASINKLGLAKTRPSRVIKPNTKYTSDDPMPSIISSTISTMSVEVTTPTITPTKQQYQNAVSGTGSNVTNITNNATPTSTGNTNVGAISTPIVTAKPRGRPRKIPTESHITSQTPFNSTPVPMSTLQVATPVPSQAASITANDSTNTSIEAHAEETLITTTSTPSVAVPTIARSGLNSPASKETKDVKDFTLATSSQTSSCSTSAVLSQATPAPSPAKMMRFSSKARAAQALEDLSKSQQENAQLREEITSLKDEIESLKKQFSYTGQMVPKIEYDLLLEKHEVELNKAKSSWWCSVCKQPPRYYCCWNTTYCTVECQKTHWYQRHKYDCLRQKGCQKSNSTINNNNSTIRQYQTNNNNANQAPRAAAICATQNK